MSMERPQLQPGLSPGVAPSATLLGKHLSDEWGHRGYLLCAHPTQDCEPTGTGGERIEPKGSRESLDPSITQPRPFISLLKAASPPLHFYLLYIDHCLLWRSYSACVYAYENKLKVNKRYIKQDHQVFVTRNKENKSSIPLCFCIYLGQSMRRMAFCSHLVQQYTFV